MAMLSKFLSDRRGNFALIASLLAPVLLGVVGLSIDFSIYFNQKSRMQETADEAALVAVREAALQGWDTARAQAVADDFVGANLTDASMAGGTYMAETRVDEDSQTVTVSIRQDGHGYFLLGLFKSNPQIGVSAQAAFAGQENICVLTLDGKSADALNLSGISTVTAEDCAVYSNSTSPYGLNVRRGATLTARLTCTSGGYRGSSADISPEPVTDCPELPDPLASRTPPEIGKCMRMPKLPVGKIILRPGTYCGGIVAKGASVLILTPGEYIIKDGPLDISGNSTVIGENVGFYLTGDDAVFRFGAGTTLALSAPKKGPLTGILFFEDRDAPSGRVFEIASKDALKFVGTVYLPKSKLVVSHGSRLGLASDWTAIVANQLEVRHGPKLQLNADYAGSDIPVPDGIAGDSGTAYLKR